VSSDLSPLFCAPLPPPSAKVLPRPSISLSPTGVTAPGANVTIQCQGQRRYVRFFLHKAGDLNPQRHMDPPGNRAEFRIPTVGRQHGGNYSCSYRNRSEPFLSSEPSDPLWLVVAGREYPKPTISESPSRVVALGGNVTIRCEGRQRSMEFFLRKAGHPNLQVRTVPDGTVAEFPITSARREHDGSNTCHYTYRAGRAAYSEPSDPVQIIVAGEGPSQHLGSHPHTQTDPSRWDVQPKHWVEGGYLSPVVLCGWGVGPQGRSRSSTWATALLGKLRPQSQTCWTGGRGLHSRGSASC
uniref:Ig-like domain-containing protein n=1 Tax=Chrysemys picta bellii TaxID=8478 RepID=A0A8C3HUC4_CHRPI